jgi:parallel beta-helix repeat protein
MRKNSQPQLQIFLTLVLIFCLVGWNYSHVAAAGTTYYVDRTNPSCSDGGSGTTATSPFCTIAKAASLAVLGDTVRVLAGSYAETISIPRSGSLGLPITYSAASGVVLTGNGSAIGSAFRMSGKSYIVVDGFTITGTVDYGIYVFGSHNITISNNHVTYSGSPASGSTRAGIYINSTTSSTISGNTIDHNSSHGIQLINGSNNNVINGNIAFANAQKWQRDASGIRLDASNNNTILHNIAYANEDSGMTNYTASSVNFFIGNLSYGNGDHGIDNYNAPNNILIGNTAQGNHTAGFNFEGDRAGGSSGATLRNNISIDNGINPVTGQKSNIRVDALSVPGTTIDYDIVYLTSAGTVEIQWNGINYSTLATFRAAVTGQEVHGIQADPLFVSPVPYATRPPAVRVGDFHIQSGSPAIDSASADAPSEPLLDLDGNTRADDPATTNTGAGVRAYDDRGVYEFQPVGRTPTATAPLSTSTPTNTPLPTATFTPTVASSSLTFIANADSYVYQGGANLNYGTNAQLRVDGDAGTIYESYLKFSVSGITGTIKSAILRVYSTSATADGPTVYATTDWTEKGITWNTRPARTSSGLDDKGAIAIGVWIPYNVTAQIISDGTYSFVLVPTGNDAVSFSSREGTKPPQLVLTFAP